MRRYVNSQKRKISTCKNRQFFDLAHSNQTLTTNVSALTEYAVHFEVLFSPKCSDAFIIAVDIYDGLRFVKNNAMPGNLCKSENLLRAHYPFYCLTISHQQ